MRRVRPKTLSLLVLLSLTFVISNRIPVNPPQTAANPLFSADFSPPLNESIPVPIPPTISLGYGLAPPHVFPGPLSIAVLCAEFTNQNHTKTKNEIQDTIFNRVNQYYREASYDRVTLIGTVSRWYQMNKTTGFYGRDSSLSIDDPNGDGSADTWNLIQDVITAADPDIDFSQYSYLIVVHSGPGQETSGNTNDIWSCAYIMGIWFKTRHGVSYSKAALVPEMENQGADTVGVIAHEFGHLLGLPDLYDPYGRSDYTGRWELYGRGLWNGNPPGSTPAGMFAWEKIRLGWISDSQIAVVPIGVFRNITLGPIEQNATTLVVKIPIIDQTYYLMELRQRIGFDIGLPDIGLLFTYVDGTTGGPGSVRVINANNPLKSTLDDATLKPGRTFSDTTNKVFVSILRSSGQNYLVLVNRLGAVADLAATKLDITPYPPRSGRIVTFTFQIANQGTVAASSFIVQVYLDGNLLYTNSYTLDVNQIQTIQLSWNGTMGRHQVRCVVDSSGQTNDINRLNNEISQEFIVGSILAVRLPWTGASILVNGTIYAANGATVEVPVLSGMQTLEVPSERLLRVGARQLFVRWNDGLTSNPRTYRTTGDVTLSVEYKTQYRLTIDSIKGETSGDGWYDENNVATAKAVSPSLMSSGKTRLVFSYWSGNYTSNATTLQLTMNAPYNLTANWIVEHYLTITSSVNGFPEQGWYREGRLVQLRASSPIDQGNHSRKIFVNWSGDLVSNSTEITVIMDGPKAIVANWRTEFELRVSSERGKPSGQGWIPQGETARFSIESTISGSDGVRYVFTRWTGDYSSTSNEGSIVMNSPKTVNANWKTQYMVKFRVLGVPNGTIVGIKVNYRWWNGSAPLSFSEWIDAGSNMTFEAPLKIQTGSVWFIMESWRNLNRQPVDSPLVVNMPGSLDLAYTKKPKGLLHILESAYGSDNSAQLLFLETIREQYLVRTFAGKHVCDIFGQVFDNVTPNLSTAMGENPILKSFLRVLLYPIFRILGVSASIYFTIGPLSEISFFVAGFVASMLVGVVYMSPILVPLVLARRRRKLTFGKSTPKYVGIGLLISVELAVLGEVTGAPITTAAATFLLLILSACLSAFMVALAAHWFIRRTRTARMERAKRHLPKSLMGLPPKSF